MTDVVSQISHGISIFKSLHDLTKLAYVKGRTRLTNPLRVEKLSDDVFSSSISYGSIVTVRGVISRFGSVYRPLTYTPTIPVKTTDQRVGFSFSPQGLLLEEHRAKIEFGLFQFPVQSLPPVTGGEGIFSVAFLYPEEFDGFILSNDAEKEGRGADDHLAIKSADRSIPVLISEEVLANISESRVTLTGVVSLLPDSLVDEFGRGLCSARESFSYHFLRLTSRKVGFCIDCRRKESSDFNIQRRLSTLRGALYLEGHFDNAPVDLVQEDLRGCIPKGLAINFEYEKFPGKRHYLTQADGMSLTATKDGIFGFYTEANLADDRDLDFALRRLQEFQNGFRKGVEKFVKDRHSSLVKFKPDFIFDYRRQTYFHPDGVLSSPKVDEALSLTPESRSAAEWLKNASNKSS